MILPPDIVTAERLLIVPFAAVAQQRFYTLQYEI
jgi:hypothetical protein